MYFAKALFVCASLVVSTIAQSSSSRIAFTVLPSTMTAGQDITLHWGGGDGSVSKSLHVVVPWSIFLVPFANALLSSP